MQPLLKSRDLSSWHATSHRVLRPLHKLSNFSSSAESNHSKHWGNLVLTLPSVRFSRNFCQICLSLFLPWPSQKTEPQVLYLFFFLSNIHNIFRHCARITWYLINDWQKYWQTLAKDYKTSTLYFHFPRQLARESESRAQPHSPDRDQEKICSLHELVFAIHPCFRVKISDSDAFISFSSFFLPDHLWR